ncbi:hypothetical protein BSKO_03199 [Bryopsis sp. KO-2023]|nr:hypothetical protein BSKO_03199 [Bryopsis sp. KO-2023]
MLRCGGYLTHLSSYQLSSARQLRALCTKLEGVGVENASNPDQKGPSGTEKTQQNTGESAENTNHEGKTRSNRSSPKIQELLRVSHASEVGAVSFFRGQSWATSGRVDVEYFLEQERQQLESVKNMATENHSRPSAMLPALEIGGWALGVATALAPRQVSLAVAGAVQDSLAEQFNDQIRELRERGELDKVEGLRESLRNLRDTPRAPDGAPTPPDLSKITKLQDLTPESALGAAVQISCKVAMGLAKKI